MTRKQLLEILEIQEEVIDMLIEINDGDSEKVMKTLEEIAEQKLTKKETVNN